MTNNLSHKILVDVGSSTVKVYRQKHGGDPALLFTKSIAFKKNFSPEIGLLPSDINDLYLLIEAIKKENPDSQIKIYATAIFRKLSAPQQRTLIDDIFIKTGCFFNIIDQELENHYLEVALVGKFSSKDPLLLVNIGGGSTQLVVMYGEEVIERVNLDFGIGNLLEKFSGLNNPLSKHSLDVVVEYCKKKLPPLKNLPKLAFYNGGELNYMKLVGYKLNKNRLFRDSLHPSTITIKNFKEKNKEIFQKISLAVLESLMPNDPRWMHGARGCSALAQAIFLKYKISLIVPSDTNLINGVVRQEFRNVTLSGSFRKHLSYIIKIRKQLIDIHVQVLSPRFTEPKNPGEEFIVFTGEEGLSPLELERHHLNSISRCDALVICDPEGYVGASALIEIGYAQSLGKRIIFVEKPEEFMLNTLPAEVGL